MVQASGKEANGTTRLNEQFGYGYDDENQLITVIVTNGVNNSTLSRFAYDGFGRRRVRTECVWQNGGWATNALVRYVHDGMVVLQERDGNNLLTVTYTRGRDLSGSLQGAGGIGGLLSRTDQTTPTWSHAYYQADGNGNVTCLINEKQAVVARYVYEPFGNVLSMSGPLAEVNLYRFSSKEAHPVTGLVYYGFRFYDPNLQRWLNHDPLASQPLLLTLHRRNGASRTRQFPGELVAGSNLYRFVGNNPIRFVDPYGLDYGDWWDVRTWFNSGFTESWSDQANSIGQTLGDLLAGNWDNFANNYDDSTLGQAEAAGPGVHKATKICVGTATVATAAAASLMAVEAGTGFRIEVHGTHGWTLPHLQGIQGPGWGQTIWRFPPHSWTPGWWTELLK